MYDTLWDLMFKDERPKTRETIKPIKIIRALLDGIDPEDPRLYEAPSLEEIQKETKQKLKKVIRNILDDDADSNNKEKKYFVPKLQIPEEYTKNIFDEEKQPKVTNNFDFSEFEEEDDYKYRF